MCLALLATLALWLGGCSTNKVDWGMRVGAFTFDQAVMELGPPDKQAVLTDGTRVADWVTRRGGVRRVSVGYPHGYGPYGYGVGYPTYVDSLGPDYFLRLVFGPDGQLASWKKLAR